MSGEFLQWLQSARVSLASADHPPLLSFASAPSAVVTAAMNESSSSFLDFVADYIADPSC